MLELNDIEKIVVSCNFSTHISLKLCDSKVWWFHTVKPVKLYKK